LSRSLIAVIPSFYVLPPACRLAAGLATSALAVHPMESARIEVPRRVDHEVQPGSTERT